MFMDPLEGSKAKLKRSQLHLCELAREELEFSKEQMVEPRLEVLPSGETAIYLKAARLPTSGHAAIAADVIGNLRSALDLAVCEACRVEGATDTKGTYFGFATTELEWDQNVTLCKQQASRMKAASPALRSLVRDFKPWRDNGNTLLYTLSNMASADKHRELVPVGGHPGDLTIDGMKLSRPGGGRTRFQGQVGIWNRETGEALIGRVQEGSTVEIAGPCTLKAKFAFADAETLADSRAIPLLHRMGSAVEDVIDSIENYVKALHT